MFFSVWTWLSPRPHQAMDWWPVRKCLLLVLNKHDHEIQSMSLLGCSFSWGRTRESSSCSGTVGSGRGLRVCRKNKGLFSTSTYPIKVALALFSRGRYCNFETWGAAFLEFSLMKGSLMDSHWWCGLRGVPWALQHTGLHQLCHLVHHLKSHFLKGVVGLCLVMRYPVYEGKCISRNHMHFILVHTLLSCAY